MDPTTNQLRDDIRSNNGDTKLVFATVGSVVMEFCNHNPGVFVVAKGNTVAKTRLYQMQIAAHLKEVEQQFTVWGLRNEKWERFQRRRKYEAFLVKLK